MTSYPDRWDSSNGLKLTHSIYERLKARDAAGNPNVQDAIKEVMKASLEFEPFFLHSDGKRSILDVFGNEIAFVVSNRGFIPVQPNYTLTANHVPASLTSPVGSPHVMRHTEGRLARQ